MNTPTRQSDAAGPGRPWPTDGRDIEACRIAPESERVPGRVTTPSGTVHFLNVKGSLSEMARQTGRLLDELIPRGPVPFFASYLTNALQSRSSGATSNLVRWATDRLATERLVAGYRGEMRRAVEALAESTPLSTDSILEAYTLPEALLWIAGTANRVGGSTRLAKLNLCLFGGSTSAVARPPVAETMYHARNFDFAGVGSWEPAATIQFYRPDDGLDYVSVSSAGLFGGGMNAMNAAGLTLAAHEHVVDRLDLEGVPAGIAGDRAIRRARNIDEAVEILRDHPPVAGWSYVMCEGDTGEVAILELAPGREALHRLPPEEGTLGYSNIYRSGTFETTEVEGFPEYRRQSRARETRLRELTGNLIDETDVDAESMARILADFHDPTDGRERLVGRTLASVHTISSVVFEPAHRRLWVGSGSSPASRSWFVPFRLGNSAGERGGEPAADCTPFHPDPSWSRRAHGQAFSLYRDAYIRHLQGESDKRLLIVIEHSLALYPEDPSLHVLGGLLALRMGRARRAEGALRRALERVHDLPRRAKTTLYLAWALDLQEQRSSARQMYREVLHMPAADPDVARRARAGRWLAFNQKKARRLTIDFVHAEAF